MIQHHAPRVLFLAIFRHSPGIRVVEVCPSVLGVRNERKHVERKSLLRFVVDDIKRLKIVIFPFARLDIHLQVEKTACDDVVGRRQVAESAHSMEPVGLIGMT